MFHTSGYVSYANNLVVLTPASLYCTDYQLMDNIVPIPEAA